MAMLLCVALAQQVQAHVIRLIESETTDAAFDQSAKAVVQSSL